MSYYPTVYLVSALLTLAIIYGLTRFIMRTKDKKTIKIIAYVVVAIVSLPLWYVLCLPIMGSVANLMPTDKSVPCFLLSEKSCNMNLNCSASYIPPAPHGVDGSNSNFLCLSKDSLE